MDYGLQISASGALTALYRQDVLTNNLANATTVGFKPDLAAVRQRDPVRREDGVYGLPSNAMLERLGGGVFLDRNRVQFGQGSVEHTGAPLDLAIQGDGFFVVRDETDTTGDRLRLTRDGRFVRDAQSRLVTASAGLPVMDTTNRPITLPGSGKVTIDADGTVRRGAGIVAQIQLARVADTSRLDKLGHSLYRAPSVSVSARRQAEGTVRQGYVEGSGVDEITTMMRITGASRDVEANIGMIQQADRLMDRAINQLGRVT